MLHWSDAEVAGCQTWRTGSVQVVKCSDGASLMESGGEARKLPCCSSGILRSCGLRNVTTVWSRGINRAPRMGPRVIYQSIYLNIQEFSQLVLQQLELNLATSAQKQAPLACEWPPSLRCRERPQKCISKHFFLRPG